MLRPMDSLPDGPETPNDGLLTPRSGQGISPFDLGPATRRTGAYRDGTLTRWKRAAHSRFPTRQGSFCFTTHHPRILFENPQTQLCESETARALELGITFGKVDDQTWPYLDSALPRFRLDLL